MVRYQERDLGERQGEWEIMEGTLKKQLNHGKEKPNQCQKG